MKDEKSEGIGGLKENSKEMEGQRGKMSKNETEADVETILLFLLLDESVRQDERGERMDMPRYLI